MDNRKGGKRGGGGGLDHVSRKIKWLFHISRTTDKMGISRFTEKKIKKIILLIVGRISRPYETVSELVLS